MLKKGIFPLFLVLQVFLSCANDLIPESTVSQISSGITVSKELVPPSSVSASNGDYRCVKLSWNIAQNAARYNIYSTDSLNPSNAIFEKAGETKDGQTTSVIIQENPGITKYYCVTSVDLDGNESVKSNYVSATTLATPEITSIEEAENGTEITVNWYLDNCRDESSPYFNDLRFVLHLYDSTMNEIKDKESSILHAKDFSTGVPGAVVKYSYTFKNLTSKTKYYFMVEAFTFENPEENSSKIERSDKLDAETARMMTPKKVSDLYIEKGVNNKTLKVSFTLPEFCEYKESDSTYSRHPLYFKVERRYSGVENAQWETVINKLSSVEETKEEKLIYNFKLGEEDTDCGDFKITTKASTDSSMESNSNYENYIQGSLITLSFDVERGIKYDFRIQSYVDDTIKILSSEDAVAEDTGWLVSVPSFNVRSKYELSPENENVITSVNVSFNLKFEPFEKESSYTYKVQESFEEFENPNDLTKTKEPVETQVKEVSTISEINNLLYKKDTSEEKFGYYSYVFTLLDSGKNVIQTVATSEKIIVIKDRTLIPQPKNFTVEDGYANKFIISWIHPENSTYTLNYDVLDENGQKIETVSKTEDELKALTGVVLGPDASGKITVNLDAESGDVRQFYLTVKAGMTVVVYDKEGEVNAVRKTLGTAIPEIIEYDYSTIKVQWDEVQMSEVTVDGEGTVKGGFEISAKYRESSIPSSLSSDTNLTEELAVNYTITEKTLETGKKTYTCVLDKPYGYDNPLVSGLPIDFSVKATNTKDNTTSTIETETVGPAMINAQIASNTIADDAITLKWNKVKGAESYIIQRICNAPDSAVKSDTYFYAEDGLISTLNGDEGIQDRTSGKMTPSAENTVYEFTDIYKEPDIGQENNGYQVNQSKLPWGIEYDYIILPVKKGGTNQDFIFDSENFCLLTDGSKVNYTKKSDGGEGFNNVPLEYVSGATAGFGQNIRAEKAQNTKTIKVDFAHPFYTNAEPTLLRRKYGTDDEWEKVDAGTPEKLQLSYTLPTDDGFTPNEGFTPYEYIVKYNYNASNFKYPPSLDKYLKSTLETRYKYKDGDTEKEPANKGYLLNVNFEANYNGRLDGDNYVVDADYYTEKVSWERWNFNEAKIGPEKFEIYAFNPELTIGWTKIAEIASSEVFEDSTVELLDTDIRKYQTTVLLTPNGYNNKTKTNTTGLLKVLRNAKHYYKIVFPQTENTPEMALGDAKDIYAYRQITAEEMTRAATLVMAYGIQMTGPNWKTSLKERSTTYNATAPGTGYTCLKSKGGTTVIVKLTHTFDFSNFCPLLSTKSELSSTFLNVTGSMKGTTGDGGSEGQSYAPRTYTEGSFVITSSDEYNGIYDATMTISSLTVNATDGITVTLKDGTSSQFGNITPLTFGNGNWKYSANPLVDGVEEWK
ncbi:MAG: hypothetical protein PUI78_05390 [Treponema sp.]|nr:hypothetical protein [Treponema sp.]